MGQKVDPRSNTTLAPTIAPPPPLPPTPSPAAPLDQKGVRPPATAREPVNAGPSLPPPSTNDAGAVDAIDLNKAFQWVPRSPDAPPAAKDVPKSFFAGVVSGSEWKPVFDKGGSGLSKAAALADNFVFEGIGKGMDALAHTPLDVSKDIDTGIGIKATLEAKGHILAERDVPEDSPLAQGLAEAKKNDPGSVPVVSELTVHGGLNADLGATFPVGGPVTLSIGFTGSADVEYKSQRILELGHAANAELARLAHGPFTSASLIGCETGASFTLSGEANMRLDAGIGLGASIPAASDAVQIGANVEVGAYATLSGKLSLGVQKLQDGGAHMSISAQHGEGTGVQFKLLAGVQVDYDQVAQLLRDFVGSVSGGGDPTTWYNNLSSDWQRQCAQDMQGYLQLFAQNLAQGTLKSVEDAITSYTSAYLNMRDGIDISSSFQIDVDYDLTSTEQATLSRADLPEEAWAVLEQHQLVQSAGDAKFVVNAGTLAQLAYDAALRGDLRLAQRLTRVPGSGVRVDEQTQERTTTNERAIEFGLPFIEFSRDTKTIDDVTDTTTPELGRIRTTIAKFNDEVHDVFGNVEAVQGEVIVHERADDVAKGIRFRGENDNTVIELKLDHIEKYTNKAELEEFLTALVLLSKGKLHDDALYFLQHAQEPHPGLWAMLLGEQGRTVFRLHVSVLQKAIAEAIAQPLNADDMFEDIGKRLAVLTGKLPEWSKRGADRKRPGADLAMTNDLVSNLMRLSGSWRQAIASKNDELKKKAAQDVRAFLASLSEKPIAYALLAAMMDDRYRAVEVRVDNFVDGRVPFRSVFVQDGRTSEILYDVGFARIAIAQLKRFGGLLKPDDRRSLSALTSSAA